MLHSLLKDIGIFESLQIPASWKSAFSFPDWLIFALPDGLWMFSLGLIIGAIWNFTWNSTSIFWYTCALCAGLLHELLQLTQVIPGVFDWMDMLFILCGGVLPMIWFKK